MQAAVLVGPSTFKLKTVEPPEEVRTWIQVRVATCGICGSDLAIYDRDPPIPKYWPGHEIAGYSDDQLIVVNPLLTCGICELCNSGNETVCKNARMISHHLPGGFAEFVYVPEGNIRPIRTTPERAACVQPLASSLHALNVAQVVEGHRVVILGGGTIGLMLVQLAYWRGAKTVALVGRHAFQNQLGARWGAVEDDFEPDVILVAAAGDGSALQEAVDLARPRGRVVVIGNICQSRSLNLKWLVERELMVLGSQRHTRSEFETAAQIVEGEAIEIDPLITHQFGLSETSSAYSVALSKAKHQSVKVIVRPDR